MQPYLGGAFFLLLIILCVAAWRRRKRRGMSVGAGAAGAVYDLLNKDRRNALELIVEERTGYRDPEDKDGDLPNLTGR